MYSKLFEHNFWLKILKNHGEFIHDSLYPSETENIKTAKSFIQQFSQLHAYVKTLNDPSATISFSKNVEKVVEQFKTFKLDILTHQLSGNIGTHLTPTFVNHMINELQEYQNILSYIIKGEVPPIFHELHHMRGKRLISGN